ncbi:MAG: MbcA/ParS/Xre antitoxin family protein [Hyphomicrobiales bacterium]|nr:MbcA/ParS/Xre antitoxin family protein [Hyphomicrobiales bacterium]
MSNASLTLHERARGVLGSRQLAQYWLQNANPLLDGTSPAQAIATPEGRRKVEQQLAWFAGKPAADTQVAAATPDRLQDLVDDPLIKLVLERAGSGPEELLRLYRQPDGTRSAA